MTSYNRIRNNTTTILYFFEGGHTFLTAKEICSHRLTIVTGHYGTGKTEFSVNLALALAGEGEQVMMADLDIVNPYFRSRERKALLEDAGIRLICSSQACSDADVPALPAEVLTILENRDVRGVLDIGGTLRLGSYPCRLDPDSRAFELYGEPLIHERHRHRYEVNNDYRTALTDAGMRLCGMSPDGRIVEMLELPDHPYFLATQAHPEFNSRPNHPHPLFLGLISSAVLYRSEEL